VSLLSTEEWRGGFVVDTSTDPPMLSVTTLATDAIWWGGFVRDPDGRLVVIYI
jgi:hypothetical protein